MTDDKNSGKFLGGLFVGGAIGAASAYLFGTGKGKKIVRELSIKYKPMIKSLRKRLSEISEEGIKTLKNADIDTAKISKQVNSVKKTVVKQIHTGTEHVKEELETLKEKGDELMHPKTQKTESKTKK
jgi:gas vesicle protein